MDVPVDVFPKILQWLHLQHKTVNYAACNVDACLTQQHPEETDDGQLVGKGEDVPVLFGFLCLRLKHLTEMWQKAAVSKSGELAQFLICQVRSCFGCVGGAPCVSVRGRPHARVRLKLQQYMCIMHWLSQPLLVCPALHFLSVLLVNQASIKTNFSFPFTLF